MLPGLIPSPGAMSTGKTTYAFVDDVTNAVTATAQTVSLTVNSAAAGILVLLLSSRTAGSGSSPPTPTGVGWNGISATQIYWAASGTPTGSGARAAIGCYTVPITAGTSATGNVTATFSISQGYLAVCAYIVYPVVSSTPVDAQTLVNTNTAASSVTLTTALNGVTFGHAIGGNGGGTFTWTAPAIEDADFTGRSGFETVSSSHQENTGTSLTMTVTRSAAPGNNSSAQGAVSFR